MRTIKEIAQDAISRNQINLYKYMAPNIDRLRQIVDNNTLWLSHPKDFNDPWDCSYIYNFNAEPSKKRNVLNSLFKKLHPGIRRRGIYELTNRFLRSGERSVSSDIMEAKITNGICCMTERNDSILMWTHYAKNGTGVCLEFLNERSKYPFISAFPVLYSKTMPIINFYEDADESGITDALLTKSEEWSYEKEWRITDIKTKQNLPFKISNLTRIIMGHNAETPFVEEIKKLTNVLNHNVKISYAKISSSSYKIDII